MLSERVLVVPTRVFHEVGHFQGFCPDPGPYLDILLKRENIQFLPRNEVEEDPQYKQLIPYILLRHNATLFQYTRGGGHGEKRLHNLRSVGIGGHIAAQDAEGTEHPYEVGMRRELAEEVFVETPFVSDCVGLINDDQTPVGQVHLGVVHLYNLARPSVRAREGGLQDAGFRPIPRILSELDLYETWSKMCLQALFGTVSGKSQAPSHE